MQCFLISNISIKPEAWKIEHPVGTLLGADNPHPRAGRIRILNGDAC
jgi:hypothetical protein